MAATYYGTTVLEHFRRPRNQRTIERPSGAHEAHNPLCGDRVRLEVVVEGSRITDVAFTANACAICVASASLLTERVRGLSLRDAQSIPDADVSGALDAEIPPARVECALLPAQALRAVIRHLLPA